MLEITATPTRTMDGLILKGTLWKSELDHLAHLSFVFLEMNGVITTQQIFYSSQLTAPADCLTK